jgi:ABC-type transporter Mla maintaining outer membrane lipid asymmetry ATPase subunit MlaF
MLFDGKLIAVAPPEEFRRLDDPRVRRFLRADTQPATV